MPATQPGARTRSTTSGGGLATIAWSSCSPTWRRSARSEPRDGVSLFQTLLSVATASSRTRPHRRGRGRRGKRRPLGNREAPVGLAPRRATAPSRFSSGRCIRLLHLGTGVGSPALARSGSPQARGGPTFRGQMKAGAEPGQADSVVSSDTSRPPHTYCCRVAHDLSGASVAGEGASGRQLSMSAAPTRQSRPRRMPSKSRAMRRIMGIPASSSSCSRSARGRG